MALPSTPRLWCNLLVLLCARRCFVLQPNLLETLRTLLSPHLRPGTLGSAPGAP